MTQKDTKNTERRPRITLNYTDEYRKAATNDTKGHKKYRKAATDNTELHG